MEGEETFDDELLNECIESMVARSQAAEKEIVMYSPRKEHDYDLDRAAEREPIMCSPKSRIAM